MGREFRKAWTEEEVEVEIRKVMKKLDIESMPSETELRKFGEVGLRAAVYKINGIVFWRKKINEKDKAKRNWSEDLTQDQKNDCVELRKKGVKYKDIAEKYNMSINCVFRMILREEGKTKPEKKTENNNYDVIRAKEIEEICKNVELQRKKREEEFEKQRLAEIENCRWRGTFKI